jgi:hypothetical protein
MLIPLFLMWFGLPWRFLNGIHVTFCMFIRTH